MVKDSKHPEEPEDFHYGRIIELYIMTWMTHFTEQNQPMISEKLGSSGEADGNQSCHYSKNTWNYQQFKSSPKTQIIGNKTLNPEIKREPAIINSKH